MGGEAGWLRDSPAAMPVAVAAMLATGVLVGFLNGACIAWLRMPAFMVTLTSMMFFNGLAVWMAKTAVNAESIYNLPDAFLVLGRQTGLAVLLVSLAVLLAHLLLARTLLGRWICAVGHNPRTALISGVPVGGVTVSAYIISGLFAAVAAIVLTSRLETGSPNHGKTLLLDVIGAAVIGGTSLFGGKGKVSWTVCGVLFLALLGNGLNLLNVSDFLITIIKGVVILVAALLDVWRNQWTRGSSPWVRRIEGMSSAPTSHEPRTTGSEPVVSFAGIEKSFFGVRVLKRVSFDVGAGRIVGLVGENGAGKSTLMNLLGGNLRPDAGELRVAGRRYAPNDPNEARASGIAFVHQELNLFPNLSIAENLFLSDLPVVCCSWFFVRGSLLVVGGWWLVVRGSLFLIRCARFVGLTTLRPRRHEPQSTINEQPTTINEPRTTNHEQRTTISLPWIVRRALRSRTTELLQQVGLGHAPDVLVDQLPAGERQLVEIAKALGGMAGHHSR